MPKKKPAAKTSTAAKKATATKKKPVAKKAIAAKKATATKKKPAAKKTAAAKKTPTPKVSPLRGSSVDDYVRALSGWQAQVVRSIREIVASAAPGSSEAMKWGQPVFQQVGPFAYVKAFKSHVNFGFWRGHQLRTLEARLQSGGQRMAHLKIGATEDVDRDAFSNLVREAVALNVREGDPTKR